MNFVTLRDELERRGQLEESGSAAYLTHLVNAVPSALHAEAYVRLVRETAIRRRVLTCASQAAQMAHDRDLPLEELLDRVEASLFALRGRIAFQDRLQPIEAIIGQVYDMLVETHKQGAPPGAPTGFPDLDRLLGCFRPGNLVLVGARTSVGETALMLSCAVHALRAGVPSAFFSLEMTCKEIGQRLLAMETGVDALRLQMGRIREEE